MIPKPVNNEPEQYTISSYTAGEKTRYQVRAVAAGNDLDKWEFEERSDKELVLRKHIGGEKYHANHTVPDAVPLVIKTRLENAGFEIIAPTEFGTHVERDDDYTSWVRVDSDGKLRLDEKSDYFAEQILERLPEDAEFVTGGEQ